MAVKHYNLPDPGEGLVEADIVSWKVKAGDTVKTNDVVVEIETAKSLVELPIPYEGTVIELLVAEGATVEVGSPIIAVEVEVEGAEDEPAPAAAPAAAPEAEEGEQKVANLVGYGPSAGSTSRRRRRGTAAVPEAPAPAAPSIAADAPATVATPAPAPAEPSPSAAAPTTPQRAEWSGPRPMAKPPVRKLAKDHGVDLTQITPSRADGIITRADVEAFVSGSGVAAAGSAAPVAAAGASSTGLASPSGERETRIPVKGVRKMTAQAMVGSAFSAPHVTEFITVDMTRTMELVERLKGDRDFRDVKVTPLLVLAKALIVAIRRNPGVNATWDDAAQEIVQKHYVNLGIAASTPRGLIVPNIKDADRMSLRELGEAMGALVSTAREGRTPPADMAGGSITITNVGVFGVDNGTPIINPGESAILCFGAVRKMPWVVTDEQGVDQIVPRQITQLSLAFDHRLIDGDLGSRFLADVAALLEDPARALVWG